MKCMSPDCESCNPKPTCEFCGQVFDDWDDLIEHEEECEEKHEHKEAD